MTDLDGYQQETFTPWVNLGEDPVEVPMPVWNRDGVSWSAAPAPPRMHRHWPQTIVRIDGKDLARCPCSATRDDGHWMQPRQPRITPSSHRRSWWREFVGALAGRWP